MKVEIGTRIRELRLQKGITQEQLATYIGISYQAVSKWENNVTSPDIQLLPQLAVYFGVKIDEFFEMPNEVQMERIENMLDHERIISQENFTYSKKTLLEILKSEPENGRAYYLLSALYQHRATSDRDVAAEYAEKAIKYSPCTKEYHHMLIKAKNGVQGDAYYNRHDDLIAYYQTFIEQHPKYWNSYFYLLDQLIGDGYYDEAQEVLEKAKKIESTALDAMYEGDIALGTGHYEKALELWQQGEQLFSQDWKFYILRGDRMVKLKRYDDALRDYRKCMEVQPKPRIIDPLTFMVKILEERKDYQKAISLLEEQISIIQDEYNIFTGEMIDEPKREINRLKKCVVSN